MDVHKKAVLGNEQEIIYLLCRGLRLFTILAFLTKKWPGVF